MIEFLVTVIQFFVALIVLLIFFMLFLMCICVVDYILNTNMKDIIARSLIFTPIQKLRHWLLYQVHTLDKVGTINLDNNGVPKEAKSNE